MNRKSAIWKWLAAILLLAPLLLIVYVALQVLVIIPYRQEQGYTYTGAMAKFYDAMTEGDADGAKYWAGRMVYYSATARKSPRVFGGRLGRAFGYSGFSGPEYRRDSYRFLASAHEFAGDYEEALALYEGKGCSALGAGRVYYKMGRMDKAFEAFCEHALDEMKELNVDSLRKLTSHKASLARERILEADVLPYASRRRMSPFRDYEQFLLVMQREWNESENQEHHRKAMEFLQAIK